MRSVFLTVLLFFMAAPVFAVPGLSAERYSEVWNPPESHGTKARPKAHAATQTPVQAKKKRKSATTVKKIADRAALESSPGAAPSASAKGKTPKQPLPMIDLPRKVGPDGRVMRVSYPGD